MFWLPMGLVMAFGLWGLQRKLESNPLQYQIPSSSDAQSSGGILTINQTEWKGIPSVNPRKRTEFILLTPNVVMLVRLDGDNDKVYPFYFAQGKIALHKELPESNYMEFQVKPGQNITTASVVVAIVDRM